MKWTLLVLVGALGCGSTQPTTTAPAPALAPTLDQMVDAMCACKSPACADQVRTQFPGVDKPGDPTPHTVALHDYLKSCEETAREGDEVTLIGKMEDAMCACTDSSCVVRVQHDFKGFMKKEDDRYHGDVKPTPQVLKMVEHMSECAARAVDASNGGTSAHGTGLDHTGGTWHPAPSSSGGTYDTGVPACDAYLVAFDKYMSCDKIPQQVKDASRQGVEAQKAAFAELKDAPDDAKQVAADTCRQSQDALQQAAAALGCPL